MRFFAFAVLMLATAGPALADEDVKPAQLDPAAVVKQLYMASSRNYRSDASYEIWGDGSLHFHVTLKGPAGRDVYFLSGSGSTLEAALNDLKSQSSELAGIIVPQAEQTKASALSLVESIKAILFGDRKSQ